MALATTACIFPYQEPRNVAADAGDTFDIGSDAGETGAPLDSAPTFRPLNGCTPTFATSNGITYPESVSDSLSLQGRFDTGMDARCRVVSTDTGMLCVLVGTDFRLAAGQTLRLVGSRSVAIVTQNDLVIEGSLDVSGHDDGEPGAAWDRGDASGSQGGGGGNVDPGATGSSPSYARVGHNFVLALRGGGNSDDRGGGGAIQLISLCGRVVVNGTILAQGGGSARSDRGGGAGGTVWIQATNVEFGSGGRVSLAGGGGAGGSCCEQCSCSDSWTQGHPAMGASPGTGADCGSGVAGGAGGRGGASGMPPTDGLLASISNNSINCRTTVLQDAAGRGAGGGSRGRLVIQAPSNRCASVMTDGECTYRPL